MDRRKTDRRSSQSAEFRIPDISEVISILYKRKFLILSFIALPMLLGMFYIKTRPAIYRATSLVILENQTINMADFQDILAGAKFDNLTVPTQIEVLSSPALARKTIAGLGIQLSNNEQLVISRSEPLEKPAANEDQIDYTVLKAFLENLHISQQGTSRAIEISFDSVSPEYAAAIVNAHTKYYVQAQIQSKQDLAEQLNTWISEKIVTQKEESLAKAQAIQDFRAKSGMVQGLNSEDLIYQQISDIAKQLSPIETRELDLRARVELLKQGKSDVIREVIESQLIQSLKSRASIAAQELQRLKADYGTNHPDVVAAGKELSQIKNDITREVSNIRRSIENELETTVKQKELLKIKLQELQDSADTLQEKQITLKALQLEEAASQRLLDNFLSRAEEIRSQTDFARPDVHVMSFADIPGEPKGSKKALILIAILVLATLFALACVVILEMLDKGVEKKEDIKKSLNLKFLGALPKEKHPVKRVLSKERSPYIEEIKRVYIHLSAQEKTKTILFTSARVGEGKSYAAAALAAYLHSIGKKTLIIDANTLTPKIEHILGVQQSPGFYELLSGTHPISKTVYKSETGVYVMPAGHDNSFSSDLLVAGRFKKHFDELKRSYDYIIIDSAAVLHSSDTEILAGLCDETVMVSVWAKTPKKLLMKAGEMLREFSKTTPSVLLNKVPLSEMKNK